MKAHKFRRKLSGAETLKQWETLMYRQIGEVFDAVQHHANHADVNTVAKGFGLPIKVVQGIKADAYGQFAYLVRRWKETNR